MSILKGPYHILLVTVLFIGITSCGGQTKKPSAQKPGSNVAEPVLANNAQSDLDAIVSTEGQDEIDEALEILKQQGMSDDEVKTMRDVLGPLMEAEANAKKQKEARTATAAEDRKAANREAIGKLSSNVAAETGKLNVGIKGEVFSLTTRRCSIAAERTDNLMRQIWVEAVGTFREVPALMILSKSHPVGVPGNVFEHLEIWLSDIAPDESKLDIRDIVQKRQTEFDAWHAQRINAVMSDYPITDDMSLDELNARMQAQQEAMDSIDEEADSLRIPYAVARGAVKNEDGKISLLTSNVGWRGKGRTPDAFFDLEGHQLYVVAQCPQ